MKEGSLQSNVVAMYSLQIANYVMPMVTLPYLISVLGESGYGKISFAYSVVFLLVLFVDAGFNTRAAHALAQSNGNKETINRIFASTLIIKAIQCVIAFTLLFVILNSFESLNDLKPLYLVTFMTVIGSLLFPVWLYQGLQIMHFTTICSVAGRLLATILIFIYVQDSNDIVLAAFLQASATALSGLMSIHIIKSKLDLKLLYPLSELRTDMVNAWKESKELTVSEFFTNALENSGILIVGIFTNDALTGIYAAIEKISKALLSAFQPVVKALFPMLSKLWGNDVHEAELKTIMWIKRLIFSSILMAIAVFILSDLILEILFNQTWLQHSQVLEAFCLWLVFGVSALTLGRLWILASGNKVIFSKVVFYTSLFQLPLSVWAINSHGLLGLVYVLVVSEVLKTILFICMIKKGLSHANLTYNSTLSS